MGADKDVDGFHPLNAGRLALRGWLPTFVPCTPKGCMELLRRANLPVAGKTAVVLGNSNTVGTPLAMLLRDCGAAAVTVCHKAAADTPSSADHLAALTATADILVAAVGRAALVRGSWVKPGAVVVDVGINVVPARPASVVGGPLAVVHHGTMLETEPWREEGDYRRAPFPLAFPRVSPSLRPPWAPSAVPPCAAVVVFGPAALTRGRARAHAAGAGSSGTSPSRRRWGRSRRSRPCLGASGALLRPWRVAVPPLSHRWRRCVPPGEAATAQQRGGPLGAALRTAAPSPRAETGRR